MRRVWRARGQDIWDVAGRYGVQSRVAVSRNRGSAACELGKRLEALRRRAVLLIRGRTWCGGVPCGLDPHAVS